MEVSGKHRINSHFHEHVKIFMPLGFLHLKISVFLIYIFSEERMMSEDQSHIGCLALAKY